MPYQSDEDHLALHNAMCGYKEITQCRCCGSPSLHKFLDLGSQPLANAFHQPDEVLPEYPLEVYVCKSCWHTQLSIVVDPDKLFKHYLYVSGTSKTLEDFFEWNANVLESQVRMLLRANNDKRENFSVLDIACNDGSQLRQFRKLGFKTYGVDPAENLKAEAEKHCDHFYNGYWNEDAVRWLLQQMNEEPLDLITAQNVFAHTDDILQFLKDCKKVMNHKTMLVIQTSQANMYRNGEFDTVYHEHLSFFNAKSMKAICDRAGLVLNRVDKLNVHGTSYAFTIGAHKIMPMNVHDVIKEEKKAGLYKLPTYIRFGKDVQDIIFDTGLWVAGERDLRKMRVVGYGAAAKAMTFLNATGGLGIEYIVDDSPLKQDLLTPGTDIPVRPLDVLTIDNEPDPLLIVPLAWNFYDEITKKVKALRGERDTFIRYFPKLIIERPSETVSISG